MADSCAQYVSADDLKAAKESILHIEHVATSKDANGNPALVVTDPIRGVGYTNATLDGLFSDIGFKPVNGSFEDGGTLVNRWDVLLYETNGSFYQWTGTLPHTVPAGSSPFDSGSNLLPGWVDRTDLTLRTDLASQGGGNLVGLKKTILPNGLTTNVGTYYQNVEINAVTDYGLKPDFDPTTGIVNGTNNLVAAQRMMDDLYTLGTQGIACTVLIPPGNYYFNFDGSVNPGGVGLMWGRVGLGLRNVTFNGFGASFFSGSVGRLNGVFSANYGVRIRGLRVIGYGGGTLAPSRERDACFSLAYNCNGVSFESCYLANSLGDCIYLGGSLDNGALTGLFCRDITVRNCTLKERYGTGIRSYYSGSRSRLAIAIIDCVGLIVENNTIVGGLDFEPNAANQRLQNYQINNNHFHRGNYLAYTGSNPFQEEVLNGGSQVIRGDVRFQTVASGVIVQNIEVSNNDFDYGCLRQTQLAIGAVVWKNNRMFRGIMVFGHDSGTNFNQAGRVDGLQIDLALNGADDDIFELNGSGTTPPTVPAVAILIQGNLTYCRFRGVTAGNTPGAFSYLFYADPTHTAGDTGRCLFEECSILSPSDGIANFTRSDTTQWLGLTSMPSSGVAITDYRRISTDVILQQVFTLAISASGALDWNAFRMSKLVLAPSTTGLVISGINSGPQIGAEVQIRNGGANSITLAHSSSFYLKGTTNAVLDDTRKIITLQFIASGVWTEIYRNF